jgi:hypothetical protein
MLGLHFVVGTGKYTNEVKGPSDMAYVNSLIEADERRDTQANACAHPEGSIECFFDSAELSTEHAEWCSICGAYRVNSGCDNKPWTLPQSIKRMVGQS